MRYPNPSCCRPPDGMTDNEARGYLCPQCLAMLDKQYPINNFLSEGDTFMSEFVLNSPCWSDSGQPVNVENVESDPMPRLSLNHRRVNGQTVTDIVNNGVQECVCLKGNSMPRLGLQFSKTNDGGTLLKIVDNANDHSFDTTMIGGGPIKIGGDHATDKEYGPAPRMQEPVEEVMDEETRQRIGLTKSNSGSMGRPRLVFRKGPDGTISDIV